MIIFIVFVACLIALVLIGYEAGYKAGRQSRAERVLRFEE
jgi:hypothetical protein